MGNIVMHVRVCTYRDIINIGKQPDVVRDGNGYAKDIRIRITDGDLHFTPYTLLLHYVAITWFMQFIQKNTFFK